MKNERPASGPQSAYAGFYPVIAPLIMCQGVGDGRTTACVMAQAACIDALRKGKTLKEPTDQMECACPLLRRMAIQANDTKWWKNDEERTEHLRPLIPLLLDSRASLEVTKKRAALSTNTVIHSLTPMRLEWIASNTKSKKLAEEIRNGIKAIEKIETVTDKASAIKARDALSDLKSYAYAYASAYAYADAYADAYAYADADAYAQKIKYRTAYLQLFRDIAAIKE